MRSPSRIGLEYIWAQLSEIADPELPPLSIVDLGIVRRVSWSDDDDTDICIVAITPTYSGCPVIDVIADEVHSALLASGVASVRIVKQLSPPWTTAWITSVGREKLRREGIAPPVEWTGACDGGARRLPQQVTCPRCHLADTACVSEFGSTPCKALYCCRRCREPFEYFKCH